MKKEMTVLVFIIGMFQFACGNVQEVKAEVISSVGKNEIIDEIAAAEVGSTLSIEAEIEEEIEAISEVVKPMNEIDEVKEVKQEVQVQRAKAVTIEVKEEISREEKVFENLEEEPIINLVDEKGSNGNATDVEEAKKEESIVEEVKLIEAKPDHSAFNTILGKYVDANGIVDYAGLKKGESTLDAYLSDISSNTVASSWTKAEKLAYWINAYNAFTLKLIVKNYPISSIMKLNNGKPWDEKWIKIGEKTYSLNQIENDIIRPQFKEPRIHFAVNCAAKSCPPLANKAFTASNLESLLEKQTKAFVQNSDFNQLEAGKVQVSKIFDWYGKDFGNLISFLNKYSSTKISNGASVEFTEYDWALNGK